MLYVCHNTVCCFTAVVSCQFLFSDIRFSLFFYQPTHQLIHPSPPSPPSPSPSPFSSPPSLPPFSPFPLFPLLFPMHARSLLFPDHPELVPQLFSDSGVADTLRAQQLSLEQMGQLCRTYQQLQTHTRTEN